MPAGPGPSVNVDVIFTMRLQPQAIYIIISTLASFRDPRSPTPSLVRTRRPWHLWSTTESQHRSRIISETSSIRLYMVIFGLASMQLSTCRSRRRPYRASFLGLRIEPCPLSRSLDCFCLVLLRFAVRTKKSTFHFTPLPSTASQQPHSKGLPGLAPLIALVCLGVLS